MKKMSPLKADVVLVVVAILWGTTFVASKIILGSLNPMVIIATRFILAFGLMALIFRKEIRNIAYKDLKGGAIVGSMLFVAFYMQLFALQYTAPGKQAFLAGTYVIFVPFMLWMVYKKRPELRVFAGTFLCFLGIGLLTLNKGFSISLGDGLTVLSSVFFAGHIITTNHYVKDSSPIKLTIVQFAWVGFLSTLAVVVTGQVPKSFDPSLVLPLLYLGLVCTGLAYLLQTLAQKYAKSTHTAIILSLEALFGSLLSVLIVKEVFSLQMIVGSLMILSAIVVVELKTGVKEKEEKKEIA